MKPVDLKELLEAGSHFGHKTNKWNPKASAFIYKAVGDTHIIDLAKTKEGLEKAAKVIYDIVASGKTVMFVGTKRQAAPILRDLATKVEAPFFSARWIGGFITNWDEVKKNMEKLQQIRKDLSDQLAMSRFTKRERGLMDREANKLESIYGGVIEMTERPAAIFVIDVRKEMAALQEANQYGIPTIGIVDTNADPTLVKYAIPANDDAVGSLTYILGYIMDVYKSGREKFKNPPAQPKAKPEVKKEVKKETKKEDKPSFAKAMEGKEEKPAKAQIKEEKPIKAKADSAEKKAVKPKARAKKEQA